jgi:beta-mannosidase
MNPPSYGMWNGESPYPQPSKYLDFADRGLEVKARRGATAGERILTISARRPVKCLVFLWVRKRGVMKDTELDLSNWKLL